MKNWRVLTFCLVGILVFAWTGSAVAGPKVAIVQGDEKILKDSTILPERFGSFLPKRPEGGRAHRPRAAGVQVRLLQRNRPGLGPGNLCRC